MRRNISLSISEPIIYSKDGTYTILIEDRQANSSRRVDIRVEETLREFALRGFAWVVFTKMESKWEVATFPVGLQPMPIFKYVHDDQITEIHGKYSVNEQTEEGVENIKIKCLLLPKTNKPKLNTTVGSFWPALSCAYSQKSFLGVQR